MNFGDNRQKCKILRIFESPSLGHFLEPLFMLAFEGIRQKVNRALEDRKIFAVSQREAQKQLFIESRLRLVLVADVMSDRSKLPNSGVIC